MYKTVAFLLLNNSNKLDQYKVNLCSLPIRYLLSCYLTGDILPSLCLHIPMHSLSLAIIE